MKGKCGIVVQKNAERPPVYRLAVSLVQDDFGGEILRGTFAGCYKKTPSEERAQEGAKSAALTHRTTSKSTMRAARACAICYKKQTGEGGILERALRSRSHRA